MKKELKDYLHLYLGCEVETEGAKIMPLDIELLRLFRNNKIGLTPILRPLSDMTEDESKKLGWIYPFVNIHPVKAWRMLADEWCFLLKNHFDIFGLIESGLAIDKTGLL